MVSPRRQRRPRPVRRGEAGYNLVILMVMVTVLGILVAAALPAWSTAIRREQEKELIFRGFQYAEAIRVFRQRFGRPPVRLEELIEVQPRSIRRLWKDPITGKAEWGLVFAAGPGGQAGQAQPGTPTGVALPGVHSGGDQVTQGPVIGVYSLAKGESVLTFLEQHEYSQWRFTADLLTANIQRRLKPPAPPHMPGIPTPPLSTGPPDLSTRWLGRPWPPQLDMPSAQSLMPAQGGVPGVGVPGQELGGGRPQGGRPGSTPTGLPAERPDG